MGRFRGLDKRFGLDLQHSEILENKIIEVVFHFQVCLFSVSH